MSSSFTKIDHRRKAALILECDSANLTKQDLAAGQLLYRTSRHTFPQNPITLVCSLEDSDLLKNFAVLAETRRRYRTVVIVGHSNQEGLKITSDRFASWREVAIWVKPFEPHRMILLACYAGKWDPCAALFDGVPTLKEIFGSPIPAAINQQLIVYTKLAHVLWAKKENKNLNLLMQALNLFATKGLMFARTRREYENGETSGIWDVLDKSMSRF